MKLYCLVSRFPQQAKSDKCLNVEKLLILLLSSLGLAVVLCFFTSYPPISLSMHAGEQLLSVRSQKENDGNCDLSKGRWVPDLRRPLYTNSSCPTLPSSNNCLLHGRKDTDFINWRWQPENCSLPRFDPQLFLELVRGKTMAFIGDSVAKNHMDSLLCLLSKEKILARSCKDSEDRNSLHYFADHNFTLKMLWSRFLVRGEERRRAGNQSSSEFIELQLDKVDNNWARELKTLDFVIISVGHWFFRSLHLKEKGVTVGCVLCNEPGLANKDVGYGLRLAVRSALNHIGQSGHPKGLVTMLRTFSPAHFENGTWNTGGICNRTIPSLGDEGGLSPFELDLGRVQVEEVERAKRKMAGSGSVSFGVLDVTRAMLMRPDGHPGAHWGNKWMKGYNDCVHWCLPGAIDVWNDFFLAVLRRFV